MNQRVSLVLIPPMVLRMSPLQVNRRVLAPNRRLPQVTSLVSILLAPPLEPPMLHLAPDQQVNLPLVPHGVQPQNRQLSLVLNQVPNLRKSLLANLVHIRQASRPSLMAFLLPRRVLRHPEIPLLPVLNPVLYPLVYLPAHLQAPHPEDHQVSPRYYLLKDKLVDPVVRRPQDLQRSPPESQVLIRQPLRRVHPRRIQALHLLARSQHRLQSRIFLRLLHCRQFLYHRVLQPTILRCRPRSNQPPFPVKVQVSYPQYLRLPVRVVSQQRTPAIFQLVVLPLNRPSTLRLHPALLRRLHHRVAPVRHHPLNQAYLHRCPRLVLHLTRQLMNQHPNPVLTLHTVPLGPPQFPPVTAQQSHHPKTLRVVALAALL